MKKLSILAAALAFGSFAAMAAVDTPAKDGKTSAPTKACCKDGSCKACLAKKEAKTPQKG